MDALFADWGAIELAGVLGSRAAAICDSQRVKGVCALHNQSGLRHIGWDDAQVPYAFGNRAA